MTLSSGSGWSADHDAEEDDPLPTATDSPAEDHRKLADKIYDNRNRSFEGQGHRRG